MTGLTTTAVAELAGVSIGSLYQYFPNREAILGAVVERALDRLLELARVSRAATRTLSIPHACARMTEILLSEIAERVKLVEQMPVATAVSGRRELHHRAVERFVDELERAFVERGDIRIADLRTASWVIVHACDGIMQAAALAGPAVDRAAIASALATMVARYLEGDPAAFMPTAASSARGS